MRSLAAGAAPSRVPAEITTVCKLSHPARMTAGMTSALSLSGAQQSEPSTSPDSPQSALSDDPRPAGCNRTPRATAGLQGAQLPPASAAPQPDQPILQSG